MKKSTLLSKLAMAGLASGMLTLTQCSKAEKSGETDVKGTEESAPVESPALSAGGMQDSSMMDKARMDTVKTAEHSCKGMNACKGQGGCASTAGDLKDLAAKAGIPMDKAGKAHDCKGLNECRGLGGCKS